jgi:hypothetical protein
MGVQVIGLVFSGAGREGDFTWMIERADYADALFVFNDNEEQFISYRDDPASTRGCAAGGGNAAIRPYRCVSPPRAAGIPTGTLGGGGYPALTDHVRRLVDDAVAHVRSLAESHHYQRVFYSAADGSGALGTGIFAVDSAVKRYIVARLRELAEQP